MLERRVLTTVIILLCLMCAQADDLWCYECNTDLREGHVSECNDPYTPGPSLDLVSCPHNESHHCLKSIVLYRNVLVTVRGCVPTRKIDGYCRHEEYFPQSSIECYFCNDYACNGQGSYDLHILRNSGSLMAIVIFASNRLYF